MTAQPAASEVSALIAWMRRRSDAGISHADPAELAAFQNAMKDLIARIERRRGHPGDPE